MAEKNERKPRAAAKNTTAATKKPAARKAPARKPAAKRAARPQVTHEQIAFRAYELHLEGHGDELANWLRAEEELVAA